MGFVQASAGSSGTSPASATLSGVGGGNLILVVASTPTFTGLSVSDSQGSYTLIGSGNTVLSGFDFSGYYLPNTNSGTHTISSAWTGAGTGYLIAIEYSGLFVTSPLDASPSPEFNTQTAPFGAVGAITSNTYTAPTSGDTIIGVCGDVSGHTTLVAANGTQRFSSLLGIFWVVEDMVSSGSVVSTFTDATNGGTDTYGTGSFAFKTVPASLVNTTLNGRFGVQTRPAFGF